MIHADRHALSLFAQRLTQHSSLNEDESAAIRALSGQITRHRNRSDPVRVGKQDHVCLVIDGLIGRVELTRSGKRHISALFIVGDICDLASFPLEKSSIALHALSAATIMRIPHSALREMTDAFPRLTEALWRESAVSVSVLARWVAIISQGTALTRVAHLLCEMGVRMRCAGIGDGEIFPFSGTQAQIGEATGLTSVHVNRTFQALRETGAIELSRGSARVIDWALLKEIGDFDESYLRA